MDLYILKKNEYVDQAKSYVKVVDAKTLAPEEWVNDEIINFVWSQFNEQYQSSSKGTIRFACFPSFFISKLLSEGREDDPLPMYDLEIICLLLIMTSSSLQETLRSIGGHKLCFPKDD